MNPVEAALQFLETINGRDADRLVELMTEDHTFIDSLGNTISGREKARAAWKGYFNFCPDYWVSHEQVFSNGDHVAISGAAGGTIAANGKLPPENRWRIPAAWIALVDKGRIKQRRVYADNKRVYDFLARSKPQAR